MADHFITVNDILEFLDNWADLSTAEEWDRVGLQIGSPYKTVKQVMTALDITPAVVEQAASLGVDLLISHHPVIFQPLTMLNETQVPYWLVKYGIASIAMHTNMDKAAGGVNDALAAQLGLTRVSVAKDGYCRIGSLPEPLSPHDFAAWTAQRLGIPEGGIQWMKGGRPIQTVAVCSGAGGDFLAGIADRVDAFVTGELHYHEWPAPSGTTILAAGHYYTECDIKLWMARRLQEQFPSLKVTAAGDACPFELWLGNSSAAGD